MAISLRVLYWFPVAIFFILNMFFKLIIFILQNFGNGIVWCNRKVVKIGDYFTDKARNDESLDNFLADIQRRKDATKKRVDAKRVRK